MMRIHQEVQSGSYPNASSLAREFEISTKSVYRDIEFMRSSRELPLDWDGSRNGFCYTEEVGSFPTIQISEGELVALFLAEKALQHYRGTSFERPLLSAIKKMTQSMPETISLDLSEAQQAISFSTRAEPILDLEIFDLVARATSQRQQLAIEYRKPGQTKAEERTIDPYHLANINGEWFLFAFDHLRQDMRTFVPTRIRSVKPTGVVFPRPKKFSLESRLRHSFGVHSGKALYDVVIRFDSRVADMIREKKWHDSQKLVDLEDGGVDLSFQLSSFREVERWVLSWGGDALALSPPELVASIRSAAERLRTAHTSGVEIPP